ncbi:MAG: transcriptional regulator [Deltaproteobacteria bacterium]|nr:transcriptional regulator [Deltaproteobacteria bacterium]
MLRHLREGPLTARELSGLIGIREREVPAHLEHLQRSLRRTSERLQVEPAECLSCGYLFADRKRLTRPGACPRCRAQRIAAPVFSICQA